MLPLFKNNQTLMIQGTTSDAGKSVVTAGLCRLLKQQGLSVAPFKPQNMALNSAVTQDGGEIGRSQAVQAQACGLVPHTDFNPILLKPSSDSKAQVIVHGKAIEAMEATVFHDYKRFALDAVLTSHKRLCAQYDRIIVEGAGSPAEINLRENDIANMGFAEAVDCPVILVADIDRGGVFAQLVGTLELLSNTERKRIVGFIINRFRGDIALLQSGLDWLEQYTNKPVLGVLPYLKNFYLDAEDAICTQSFSSHNPHNSHKRLKVIVPVLPRISNHTDLDALRLHPEVDLQFVAIEQTCPTGDLIILPGSKNVRADLAQLKTHHWHKTLNTHLRYGGKIIGICGGYQMLGTIINDPDGIEDAAGQSEGFNLLDISTILRKQKILKNVEGRFSHPEFNKQRFSGYEIHCGITTNNNDKQNQALLHIESNDDTQTHMQSDGTYSQDNQIIGTYVHGLFDHPLACQALLKWAGMEASAPLNINEIREQQFDRLAKQMRESLAPQLLEQLTR